MSLSISTLYRWCVRRLDTNLRMNYVVYAIYLRIMNIFTATCLMRLRQRFPHFRLYFVSPLWRHSFYTHRFSFCTQLHKILQFPLIRQSVTIHYVTESLRQQVLFFFFFTCYSFTYAHACICNFLTPTSRNCIIRIS